jgi:ABC-type polysaccharide/polyol phosphate transport system ATPase subunit
MSSIPTSDTTLNSDSVISLREITKVYRLYDKPLDRLKEAVTPFGHSYHREFFALRNLSLDIRKGETVGIVGKNGSGKSTLLKIITGVLTPTSGQISVNGRISALLELGAGFNPELSGIENIFLNGTINGLPRSFIEERLESIIRFADIGEFIGQPVKSYSSGMYVRLAFAVATSIEPEILIVDEALSVGDMFFQAKCAKRMEELMARGVTTLFVSHDSSAVKSLCQRAVYLKNGLIEAIGPSGDICDQYIHDQIDDGGYFTRATLDSSDSGVSKESQPISAPLLPPSELSAFSERVSLFRKGDGPVKVLSVQLCTAQGLPTTEISYAQQLSIVVYYYSPCALPELVLAMYIKDRNQVEVLGTNNIYESCPVRNLAAGHTYRAQFLYTNHLRAGEYSLRIILADKLNTTLYFDWIDNAVLFRSVDLPGRPRWALVNPPMPFSVQQCEAAVNPEAAPV